MGRRPGRQLPTKEQIEEAHKLVDKVVPAAEPKVQPLPKSVENVISKNRKKVEASRKIAGNNEAAADTAEDVITNHVTVDKIKAASGTRDSVKSQRSVMGVSATKVSDLRSQYLPLPL